MPCAHYKKTVFARNFQTLASLKLVNKSSAAIKRSKEQIKINTSAYLQECSFTQVIMTFFSYKFQALLYTHALNIKSAPSLIPCRTFKHILLLHSLWNRAFKNSSGLHSTRNNCCRQQYFLPYRFSFIFVFSSLSLSINCINTTNSVTKMTQHERGYS